MYVYVRVHSVVRAALAIVVLVLCYRYEFVYHDLWNFRH